MAKQIAVRGKQIAVMGKKERKSIGAASSPLDKYPTGVYYSGERKERR